MIPALLAKKFDTIIASMSITEERKKKVDFTDKYYNTPPGVVAKENAGFEQSAAGLKGKRLGVQRATTHQCTAEKMFPDAELVLYATQEEVFQDLAAGRLDAQISDSLQAVEGFLKQDMGKGFAFLGDMKELGPKGPDLHAELAALPAMAQIDRVHCVGPLMGHLHAALPEHRQGQHCDTSAALAPRVPADLRAGDVVLVKGSLSMAMARIVDAIRKIGHALPPDDE